MLHSILFQDLNHRIAHLVGLRLPELVRALVDPDVGGLDVLLDGVDHPALLVHHRRKVLEDRVHVDDVGLEKVEEIQIKSNHYKVDSTPPPAA